MSINFVNFPQNALSKIFTYALENAQSVSDVNALRLTCKAFKRVMDERVLQLDENKTFQPVMHLWIALSIKSERGLSVAAVCRCVQGTVQAEWNATRAVMEEVGQGKHVNASHRALVYLSAINPLWETLDLSHNLIHWLPDECAQLQRLRAIDLSHNLLTTLPEQIRSLPELFALAVRGNPLRTVPEWLLELESLKELDVSENAALRHGRTPKEAKVVFRQLCQKGVSVLRDPEPGAKGAVKRGFKRLKGRIETESKKTWEKSKKEMKESWEWLNSPIMDIAWVAKLDARVQDWKLEMYIKTGKEFFAPHDNIMAKL